MKKCPKHPHYKPLKMPSYTCAICAALYLSAKAPRMYIRQKPKVEASKKTYSRKSKHKKT